MKFHRHLFLTEKRLPASAEWMESNTGWFFLRLNSGAAYWLGKGWTGAINPGNVLVAAPGAEGQVRASQLGEADFHYFSFCPELAASFLTLSEEHYLEKVAGKAVEKVRVLPPTSSAAQAFADLISDGEVRNTFVQRSQMMEAVSLAFAEEMARHQAPATSCGGSAEQRFKDLIQQMPDNDLVNHNPEELAALCGCSVRHFSRLFRKHLGSTIRGRQTELRLSKARQLLADTDAKIINIALESGYRHLGLFNVMFKKYLGMTPSEWRQRHLKKQGPWKPTKSIIGLFLLGSLFQGWGADKKEVEGGVTKVAAATPAQAASTAKPPSFEVKGYEITGNTLFSYDQMEGIFKKYVGSSVTIDSVRQALGDFQMAYRDRGFVTVAVALPQQQLTNGIVKVRVTEGKLAEINVLNNNYYHSNNVMRALPSLRTNILLNSLVFQQELDRANANKDRQIYPVIRPGPDPGTSALDLKVKDRFPLHERFDFNNDSTPNTPELRMNLAAQYNNLWQYDHQVGLQYSFTPEELKDANQMPRFFDQPLIANYSGFYRMPLNFSQPRENRDYRVSDFGYDEATHRFRPPPMGESSELLFYGSRSTSDTGFGLQSESVTQPSDFATKGGLQITDKIFSQSLSVNENVGVRFNQPLPDIWEIHQSLSFGLDYKRFQSTSVQNRSFQAVVFVALPDDGSGVPKFQQIPSAPQQQSRSVGSQVEYLPLALNYSARINDAKGSSSFFFNNTFNAASVFDNKNDFRIVSGSPKGNGTFYVANAGVFREQKVFGDELGISFAANGQWANQPLISNEQFGLGGRAGVRGYREGQEYGDTGWRVLVEPHTRFFNLGLVDGKAPMYVRGFAFMDYGERYLLDAPARGREGALALWGTGVGFNGAIGEWLEFRMTFGLPLKAVPGVTAYSPRLTFGLGAQF